MPEGDTIARSAARLRAAIQGRVVVGVAAPRWAGALPAVGERVTEVVSIGKHLEVEFSGGLILSTHMRMTGSWHIYRPGERWRRPRREVRVVVETDEWVAVCFSAPDVSFARRRAPGADGRPGGTKGTLHLGPDLCRPDADLEECVRRFEILDPGLTVAEALLDQRVCCGVGNVFKSEVCWAERLDPFTAVRDVPADLRRRLVTTAARQLRANLDTARRTTVPEGLAVYGRADRRCRRCGSTVNMRRHGIHARSTYWCPGCQLAPAAVPDDQVIDQ
jgi:endonuclease-8